ncbi:hypothetical protein [Pseudomonas sp. GD03766]|uniref:hypothetical protein n=1 Tax=Pseudomonas TaxID=286 RepID=UPI00244BD910|nr:hypothetical protein [Pseudomonas sp. GD03766]MDH1692595.1 hypothetical protein [Pseudomonas sp. GD03766]
MSELTKQAAPHDLPLCPNRMIVAVDAVRGAGFALELLREHLHLRASARLVYSQSSDCYWLQLDDFDRFQNPYVGMLEAVSTMPFRSGDILKREISNWTPADIARVKDADGLRAFTELGINSHSA